MGLVKFSIFCSVSFDLPKNLFISFKLSNLLTYHYSKHSLIICYFYRVGNYFLSLFLTLVMQSSIFFSLVILAKSLSVLLIFSNNQLLVLLFFSTDFYFLINFLESYFFLLFALFLVYFSFSRS